MQANTRIALLAGVVVATMASLSFAAVPFYSWFCRVTGFGGTTSVAAGPLPEVLDDTVVVRFDASTERGMPWTFRPAQRSMTVRLGETNLAFFEATNPTDRVVAGQASYNVTPDAAGGYFTKIDCFCFTEQVLQPGQTAQMPVSFYVDPAILDDPEGAYVHEITLGYTFYEIDPPEGHAELEAPAPLPLTAPRARAID